MREQPRVLAAGLFLLSWMSCEAATCTRWPEKIFVLRHAERKDSSDDGPLSAAGWRRAGGLPLALGDPSLSAIFVSEKRRTQQTALPLAEYVGLKPEIAAQGGATNIDDLAAKICAAAGQAVVVVGHSNTVPSIIQAIISTWSGMIDEKQFGDLFEINTKTGAVNKKRYGD